MEIMRPKGVDEVFFYTFDWGTKRLDAGATLVTSTFTIEPDDGSLQVSSSPPPSIIPGPPATTKFWLEGGEIGQVYIVTNHIVDSLGQHRDCSGKVKIKAK